jgi:hypothetical protein
MANSVNVKMGVSGVSQFKQNMKQAQASVKTLDEQLKLNEAQFRLTGDAEKYMQEKSELLQRQIEEQKRVVEQSQKALETMKKNGVDENSAAFQSMQQQMVRAQTALTNMESDLEGVGAAGQDAGAGVGDMNDKLSQIGQGMGVEKVTEGIGKITGTLENAAKAAWNLGKRIVQATLGAGAWADDLATEATVYGMKPEDLYRMQQTANIIDTDVSTIISARKKLKQGLLNEGKTETIEEILGIDTSNHTDEGLEDTFWNAGAAIMAMDEPLKREEAAMAAFGKSWDELIPLFSAGREEYERVRDSWNWIGDEDLQKLTTLNDTEMKLQTEWENFQHEFEAAMAPAITSVMETLTGLLQEFNAYLNSPAGQEMMDKLSAVITGFFEDIAQIDPEAAMEGLKGMLEGITGAFQWLIEKKDDVVEALKWIIAGWAGLKLAGGGLQVYNMLKGLQLMRGGGGAEMAAGAGSGVSSGLNGVLAGGGGGGGASAAAAAGGMKTSFLAGGGLAGVGVLAAGALMVDGIIRDMKLVNIAYQKGEEQMEHTAEVANDFADSEFFDIWQTLNGYRTVGGDTAAEYEAMTAFAQRFMEWYNDRDGTVEDDELYNLYDVLGQEQTDQLALSLSKYLEGDEMYSNEEIDSFLVPMDDTLRRIEGYMEQESRKNTLTHDDIAVFRNLPEKLKEAVRSGAEEANLTVSGVVVNEIGRRTRKNLWDDVFTYVN